jgi:hypothetical protein
MMSDPGANDAELFYDSLVRSYVHAPRFLRRDWLAERVETAMAAPDCRFVLLTAGPGAGKTSFVAQLAQDHPEWPRYFIRRDQFTPVGDPGAHSFLLQTGLQLAARFPEAFEQEQLRVSVEQRIGAVADGGRVVGAEIERIVSSPFYKAVVQVSQTVGLAAGSVAGLRVGEWIADPRLIDLGNLQYMALIDPARALLRLRPDMHLILLVDALDELRYRSGGESLLDWLAACPELPPNVDIVLTSRPDDGAQVAQVALRFFGRRRHKGLDALAGL